MSNNTEEYDLRIYSVEAIRIAISNYASICRIDYQLDGELARCRFNIKDKYIDRVIKEFDNFLIELMQHEGGHSNGNS